MRKRYLKIKTWIVIKLIQYGLIRNIWYPCETELAKIRGKELAKFFKSQPTTKQKYNIKQPTARAGFRRGQRREYDKI